MVGITCLAVPSRQASPQARRGRLARRDHGVDFEDKRGKHRTEL